MAVDDVDDSWWESSLLDEVAHVQHGQWGLLSQLQDNGVATAESRSKLPASHAQGVVPGDDLTANTNGLLQRVCKLARADIEDLTKILVGKAGVVSQDGDDLLDVLGQGCGIGLAVVQALNGGKDFSILVDEVRELGHETTALGAGQALP